MTIARLPLQPFADQPGLLCLPAHPISSVEVTDATKQVAIVTTKPEFTVGLQALADKINPPKQVTNLFIAMEFLEPMDIALLGESEGEAIKASEGPLCRELDLGEKCFVSWTVFYLLR